MEKLCIFGMLPSTATPGGAASRVGSGIGWLAAATLLAGCGPLGWGDQTLLVAGPVVATAQPPSSEEHYCAWYGDARDGVLYFGQSAFWSAMRAADGNPRADLEHPGPQLVGRFDLGRRELLPPLDVTSPGARAGLWDVYAHANGRIYFTTYFESMGSVDPASGSVTRFPELGLGLNEIAPGPDDSILVSRYGPLDGRRGSVVVLSPDGRLRAELPLEPPPSYVSAPKTVAYDPNLREIWVTMDLLPDGEGPVRNDTYVVGLDGRERRRIEQPEVQFVVFDAGGTGYRAEVEGPELRLVRSAPGSEPQRIPLDDGFLREFDFVQDIQLGPDGEAMVTRWSGFVHRVDAAGSVHTWRLPALQEGGLYYSGVPADGGVCVTHCAEVTVVCAR
jgi:hypothetical protein